MAREALRCIKSQVMHSVATEALRHVWSRDALRHVWSRDASRDNRASFGGVIRPLDTSLDHLTRAGGCHSDHDTLLQTHDTLLQTHPFIHIGQDTHSHSKRERQTHCNTTATATPGRQPDALLGVPTVCRRRHRQVSRQVPHSRQLSHPPAPLHTTNTCSPHTPHAHTRKHGEDTWEVKACRRRR